MRIITNEHYVTVMKLDLYFVELGNVGMLTGTCIWKSIRLTVDLIR